MATFRPSPPRTLESLAPGPIRSLYPDCAFLTCGQVAKAMNCQRRHISNLCEEGSIHGAVSISGEHNERHKNCWRIPVAAVEAWLKRRAAQVG